MRALIIGIDSAIGQALSRAFNARGIAWMGTSRRPDPTGRSVALDLRTLDGLDRLPDADVGYLCAAITGHMERHADPALSRQVNVEAPAAIARTLGGRGAHMVFLSSNAVFDGAKPLRHEAEPVSPMTQYGREKVEGEQRILALGNAAILRLTKVLTPGLPLLRGWLDDLANGRVVRPVHDMQIAPLTLDQVTAALAALGSQRAEGVFHQSGARDISYADVARHLAQRLGADPGLVQPWSRTEAGITVGGYGRYSCLATERLTRLTGFAPPEPTAVLDEVYGLGATR